MKKKLENGDEVKDTNCRSIFM